MLVAEDNRIAPPEREFIRALNLFLESPLTPFGERKISQMLLDYKNKNGIYIDREVLSEPIVKIVYRNGSPEKIPLPKGKKYVDKNTIIRSVCNFLEVAEHEVRSIRRQNNLVHARRMCYYFLFYGTHMNKSDIGKEFGKDHSTILIALRRLNDLIVTEPAVAHQVSFLKKYFIEQINNK